jgi:Rrf2 family nitric oxide-sensitive transcriptional repressor
VFNELAALGYVETIRGKSGGARLAKSPDEIHIGTVVRQVEPELGVVPCLRTGEAPCVIAPACRLKRLLSSATDRFIAELDEHTLADLLEPRRKLQRLLELGAGRAPSRSSSTPARSVQSRRLISRE